MGEDDEHLPGTERLFDADGNVVASQAGLRKHGDIVLDPQPTDSPNDPLRWSLPRKYWHAFLVCFVTALTAATSNDAGSAQSAQNEELGLSWTSLNVAVGVLFLGIGYTTLLLSPCAWLYGRRITYLICITLGLFGAVWFAEIQTTSDSIWNQLFVGASEACAEATAQLSLSDIFFQHQRGTVLGAYILSTSIGTYLGPLVANYLADRVGWRWIGWCSAIISTCTLLVFYFGLEETVFDRDEAAKRAAALEAPPSPCLNDDSARIPGMSKGITNSLSTDTSGTTKGGMCTDIATLKIVCDDGDGALGGGIPGASGTLGIDAAAPASFIPKTYFQRIALITPAPNIRGLGLVQYVKTLWHTLYLLPYPAVLYSGLQWGAQNAWLTFYLTVEEETWTSPPFNYDDAKDGLMNVPCLIGAIFGCIYGGPLSDYFVRWMARRNGGVREAEHRLYLMFLAALISPLGMFLFGVGSNTSMGWPIPYVGLAFIGFGWGCTGDLSMAYLMDAYPDIVLEGMVGVAVINNTIACIFTFATSPWMDAQGVLLTMVAVGILDFLFIMTSWPMIVYGKACRKWTKARYERFVLVRDGE